MKNQLQWVTVLGCGLLVGACQRIDRVEASSHSMTFGAAGASQVVSAKVLDQNRQPMEKAELTFSSDKPDVASVDATGKVTALKSGVARIIAKSGEKDDSIAVDVRIPASIQVSPTELKIQGIGGTAVVATKVMDQINRRITGAPVVLTVADPTKATLLPDNKFGATITAKDVGETVVTATLGKISTPVKLTVTLPDFASISVDPADADLKPAGTQQLTAAAKTTDGKAVANIPFKYTSSDADVATVSPTGLVTAVAKGKATITVAAADKTATVELKIKK